MTQTMARRQILFVIGSPRSGSTLVSLIAGAHSRSFAIGELEGLRAADRRRRKLGRATICECCEDGCPVWGDPQLERHVAARLDPPRLARLLPARLRASTYAPIFDVTGADVLIDSSKRPDWLAQQLAIPRNWHGVVPRVLFVTRDGRGTVNSLARWRPEEPFETHVRKWLTDVRRAESAFALVPSEDRLRLAYEDIAGDPETAASRICDFLGLPGEPGMGSYWTHEHHPMRGNLGTLSLITGQSVSTLGRAGFYAELGRNVRPDETWRTAMSADDLRIFDDIAGTANGAYAVE
jgi:hypothetical protein